MQEQLATKDPLVKLVYKANKDTPEKTVKEVSPENADCKDHPGSRGRLVGRDPTAK